MKNIKGNIKSIDRTQDLEVPKSMELGPGPRPYDSAPPDSPKIEFSILVESGIIFCNILIIFHYRFSIPN